MHHDTRSRLFAGALLIGVLLFCFCTAERAIAQTMPTSSQIAVQSSEPKSGDIDARLSEIKSAVASANRSNILSQIISGVTAVIALIAVWANYQSSAESRKVSHEIGIGAIFEKAREEERASLRRQIDEFYAPFIQLRNSSRFLYEKAFLPRRSKAELEQFQDSSGHFRTMIALVRGHKFEGVDDVLLKQLIRIGSLTASLIYEKIGLVNDPPLQEALARATTHFRLMRLARAGALVGGGKEFEEFVFPHALDASVLKKLGELHQRLDELSRAGGNREQVASITSNYKNDESEAQLEASS